MERTTAACGNKRQTHTGFQVCRGGDEKESLFRTESTLNFKKALQMSLLELKSYCFTDINVSPNIMALPTA